MTGWVEVKAILCIAYSNLKLLVDHIAGFWLVDGSKCLVQGTV
jgi:hypothetical protein